MEYEDIVCGRNSVLELLKSEKDINKLFIEKGNRSGSINEIIAKAKQNHIVIVEVDKRKLDTMAANHQGVVAIVPPFEYCDIYDILDYAKAKDEDPFIVILDGIEDPHNLGAIIRTCETAGVHGVIIPKRRSASVNSTVVKVSEGATTYVKIARVTNLNDTISKLKDAGLWIIGTDMSAQTYYYDQDLKGPIAIVIGSEGFGMSDLVKKNTDIFIKIPMAGKITSLNASVSAGIVIYEAVKQRKQ
jgi:23S rRNA (guanosine2251-2'-O)-methyltransferase